MNSVSIPLALTSRTRGQGHQPMKKVRNMFRTDDFGLQANDKGSPPPPRAMIQVRFRRKRPMKKVPHL
jgi:hypothetical protein